jgi:hypothetical protein
MIGTAAHSYKAATGAYPVTLAGLSQFITDPMLLQGVAGGYAFMLTETFTQCAALAEPVLPGVTGFETPANVTAVLAAMGDGSVRFVDIRSPQTRCASARETKFIDAVPAVQFSELTGRVATRRTLALANSLCAKLSGAQATGSRGNSNGSAGPFSERSTGASQ